MPSTWFKSEYFSQASFTGLWTSREYVSNGVQESLSNMGSVETIHTINIGITDIFVTYCVMHELDGPNISQKCIKNDFSSWRNTNFQVIWTGTSNCLICMSRVELCELHKLCCNYPKWKKQKCKELLLPGPSLTTTIISTVSIIIASIQHCHQCEHYSSFAEFKIIGRKTWNSLKPKDLCVVQM